jgi:hypothetical protein
VAPAADAGEEDYRERWLKLPDDLWVLAGPRFRALDLTMPFVGVSGASRAITEADVPGLCRSAEAAGRTDIGGEILIEL